MEKKYSRFKKFRANFREFWHRFCKNKIAVVALVVFIAIILTAVFANQIVDYEQDVIRQDIANRHQPPSAEHPFGTDTFGRDILARVIYGSRLSLFIGIAAVFLGFLGGVAFGAPAGFYGGKIDMVLMRFTDVVLAIPQTILAIAVVSVLGTGVRNMLIALSVACIPPYARLIRASILQVKDMEYVEAARVIGCSDRRTILKHIMPNIVGPVVVQCTLGVASTIMSAAGMSFLGLGIAPPAPEWGAMLSEGRNVIRYFPHVTMFPGLAIVVTVLALNLLGDGLRDALDPRLKGNV